MNDLAMSDLDSIEMNDAMLRFTEGGGAVPEAMHSQFPAQGLGQVPGGSGPWYKSPTFLTVTGLGIAAVLLTIYLATKKDE
jgi:hypothetical protein